MNMLCNLQPFDYAQDKPAIRTLLFASCLLFSLTACAPQPLTVTREPVTLSLVAADSCGPLAEELAAAYEKSHPWVTVHVAVFDSLLAEEMLRTGGVDLALLSWLGETGRQTAGEDEESWWSRPFAHDDVAVIVHPAVPFTEIELAHLQEIFRGRVQEWGGKVLTVVSREEGSGARAAFESVVLGGYDVTLTAVVMPSSEAVVEYVARTPGAIGYVSMYRLDDRVRALPVEGVPPSLSTTADGSYLLSRQFYLAATSAPTGEACQFAQWVLGLEGQAVIGREGN